MIRRLASGCSRRPPNLAVTLEREFTEIRRKSEQEEASALLEFSSVTMDEAPPRARFTSRESGGARHAATLIAATPTGVLVFYLEALGKSSAEFAPRADLILSSVVIK